jgi:dTMP kinase
MIFGILCKAMNYKVDFDISFKKNNLPGKLIVLEGVDGSGKTTQAKILSETLIKMGHKVWVTKNPTDHTIGKFIRNDILSGKEKVPPQAIQYLFAADRVVQQDEIIQKLNDGYVIICDRYFWSSVAYGMTDLNEVSDRLLTSYSILSFYHQFLIPDLTIFLEIDSDTAVSRIEDKKDKEIYENREKIEKIIKMYEYITQKFPNELTILDGKKDLNSVSEEILSKVKVAIEKI